MSKQFLSLLVGAVMLVLLSGLPASAQESGSDADKTFASLDGNKDGKLSQAEFNRLYEMQGKADTSAQQKQQEFKTWDADGDGSVSKAEFTAKYSGS
jgi:Ca2+-binding EF-hand superfamily protein